MFDGVCCVYFFFFKQKTAYEMRISDWSSDVCSSDLFARPVTRKRPGESLDSNRTPSAKRGAIYSEKELQMLESVKIQRRQSEIRSALRSEEHTSELQSLMRISYAVFCLKKKKTNNTLPRHATQQRTVT